MSRQDEVSGHCLGPRLTSPRFSPSSCVQEHQRQALATHGCACGGGLGSRLSRVGGAQSRTLGTGQTRRHLLSLGSTLFVLRSV